MDEMAVDPAEPVTLAESLVALQAQCAGGVVVVTLDDQTTQIYIADGSPIAVQTNADPEPTSDADTIWEALVGCLQWVEPSIVFDDSASVPPELGGSPCQVEPLILEAVRRQFDVNELDTAIGPFMAHRPRVLGDVSTIAERCGLYGADEQDYIALASRAETVEDLLAEGPLDLLEAYQVLYGLVLLGAVSLHDPGDPWDEPENIEPMAPAHEEPIDAFGEEPIDAFDEEPAEKDGDRLSGEVAAAFDPGLAEFLLDVVQESDAPYSQPTGAASPEGDDFPPLDQDDSLPPPPPRDAAPAQAPAPAPSDDEDDDFPPLDQDSLPPPPKDEPAQPPDRSAPQPPPAPDPPPPPAPKPSRADLLRQADEDAQRILAEARAAKERQGRERAAADGSAKPPRDGSPPRDPRPAPANPTAPSTPAARRDPPSRIDDSRPRPDPRKPRRRSAGGRVILEERVGPTSAHDSRVAVRTSRKPVATSVRPRPVVTRRQRIPSNPSHASSPPTSDPGGSMPPRSPSPRSSPVPRDSRAPSPRTPAPRITPPDQRSVTPPGRRGTPATGRGVTPSQRGVTPPGRSSSPRGSNPSFASDPGPPSHPRGGAMTPPPVSTPGRSSDPGRASNPGTSERQKQLAQLHLKKGKRFLYRNNATRALPELEKAVDLDPESVELQLFVLWTRFTVEPGGADQMKAIERELKELAGKAMSDDRKFGFAHFVMGQLALREGRNGDAVRSLGTAVKLDPDNQDAKRGHQIAKRRATK